MEVLVVWNALEHRAIDSVLGQGWMHASKHCLPRTERNDAVELEVQVYVEVLLGSENQSDPRWLTPYVMFAASQAS